MLVRGEAGFLKENVQKSEPCRSGHQMALKIAFLPAESKDGSGWLNI